MVRRADTGAGSGNRGSRHVRRNQDLPQGSLFRSIQRRFLLLSPHDTSGLQKVAGPLQYDSTGLDDIRLSPTALLKTASSLPLKGHHKTAGMKFPPCPGNNSTKKTFI